MGVVTDESQTETRRPKRFILSIWDEPREIDNADAVLRGSIVAVSQDGQDDGGNTPNRVHFQTLGGIVPAIQRLLSR